MSDTPPTNKSMRAVMTLPLLILVARNKIFAFSDSAENVTFTFLILNAVNES